MEEWERHGNKFKILLETNFSLKVLTFQLSNVTELEIPKYAYD